MPVPAIGENQSIRRRLWNRLRGRVTMPRCWVAATAVLFLSVLLIGGWFIEQSVARGYAIGLYVEAMELHASNHKQLPGTLAEIATEYRPENGFRLPDARYPIPIYRPIDYSAVQPATRYLVLLEPPNAKAFWNRYVVYWSPIECVAQIEAAYAWQVDDLIAADDAARQRAASATSRPVPTAQ
jgi:hypothetical protein